MYVKNIKELEELTVERLFPMTVAEFDSLSMDLIRRFGLAAWRRLFNKRMLEFYLPEAKKKACAVTVKEAKFIREKVQEIIERKKLEGHIKRDPLKLGSRWTTGKLGEYAFAKQLGYNYVDLEAFNLSSKGDIPDVLGLAGIKTSKLGNFPLVSRRRSEYPQIIFVEDKNRTYYNTGIYHVEDLNAYTEDKLVKDRNALYSKTAFYNYSRGLPFGSGLTNFYDAVSNVTHRSFEEVKAIGDAEIQKLEAKKSEQKDMPAWWNW